MRDRSYLSKKGNAALWFALLGAGAIWGGAQFIQYLVVPWSCSHQSTLPLHLISLLALALTLFAGFIGYTVWREEGAKWSGDRGTREDRTRFMAEIGMAVSALFALLLLGHWISILVYGPCIPLPRLPFTPDASLRASELLLAHPGAPLAPHDFWRAWSADPAIVLSLIWGGVFYGAGLQYAPRKIRKRAFAFALGCVALAIALLSPLHALSEVLFSAHMAQHTLLVAVAAPLIAFSRPVLISLWALPRGTRKRIAQHPFSRTLARCTQWSPAQTFALHGITLWVWHLPVLYQASLSSGVVHSIQHITFLITGIAFWAALFDVRKRSFAYGTGVFYIFATAVHTSVLGALMTLAPLAWYARYAETTNAWGLTQLEDQQLAGLIMWVPAGLVYTLVALVLLAAWLRESEQRGRVRALRTTTAACACLLLLNCDAPPGVTRDAMTPRAAAGLTGGAPTKGKRTIERFGCGHCHEISGVTGANGLVGPPLDGIGRRLYIAGVLTNTPENMARWIHDPKAVDPLTVMPRLGVTIQQARDITAYLYTLK